MGGYAGYAPGANSRVADRRTPLEEALRSLPVDKAMETLELIEKLTRNVVRSPDEEKFTHVKFSNPKIAATVRDVSNAISLMKEMGWQEEPEGLALPPSIRFA